MSPAIKQRPRILLQKGKNQQQCRIQRRSSPSTQPCTPAMRQQRLSMGTLPAKTRPQQPQPTPPAFTTTRSHHSPTRVTEESWRWSDNNHTTIITNSKGYQTSTSDSPRRYYTAKAEWQKPFPYGFYHPSNSFVPGTSEVKLLLSLSLLSLLFNFFFSSLFSLLSSHLPNIYVIIIISINVVPGGTKQEVFQFRYPGIFGKSWLASYLKRYLVMIA